MINYELAKQLKDAGFPQYEGIANKGTLYLYASNGLKTFRSLSIPTPWIASPTLEELIEACGDEFCCLYRVDRTDDGKGIFWSAGYDNLMVNHLTGSTPTEAVAMLWLALNKK